MCIRQSRRITKHKCVNCNSPITPMHNHTSIHSPPISRTTTDTTQITNTKVYRIILIPYNASHPVYASAVSVGLMPALPYGPTESNKDHAGAGALPL